MMLPLLFACSPDPRPLDLGPLLGGEVQTVPIRPADHRLHLQYDMHRVLTRDRTINETLDLSARLELLPDHTFRLCHWGEQTSGGTRSYHETRTVEQIATPDLHQSLSTGTWSGDTLTLTHQSSRCDLDPSPVDPHTLPCAITLDGPWPGAIVCHGETPGWELLALFSAGTDRDGLWQTREDPSLRHPDPTPPGARPWFVFPPAPGASLRFSDRREGFPIQLERQNHTVGDGPAASGR